MSLPLLLGADETLRGIARSRLEAAIREGFQFRIERQQHGPAGVAPVWQLKLFKGLGRDMQFFARTWAPPAKLLEQHSIAAIAEHFADEVGYLDAQRRRKNGLVVGVAGKWRKWGRPS